LIERLQSRGHRAVLAGGCVRDSLLGRSPKDLDVATSALPEQVEALFDSTVPVGKAFGTIVVVLEGDSFEVTTFRKDGPYLDGRHPSRIEFSDMQEDSQRRDFTVNALFYDPVSETLSDFVQGRADLEHGILRTVGPPEERFAEDRLRLLRAVRFRAQLGFVIEERTWSAVQARAAEIQTVSVERITAEMSRLLESPYVVLGLESFLASGMAEFIWPELVAAQGWEAGELVDGQHGFGWHYVFALIALKVGMTAEQARVRLQNWKASKAGIGSVVKMLNGARTLLEARSSRAVRAEILGDEFFAEVLALVRGSSKSELDRVQGWIEEYLQVADSLGRLPQAWLTGEDLLKAGVSPGKKMGLLLKALYQEQLEGRIRSKAEALERMRHLS